MNSEQEAASLQSRVRRWPVAPSSNRLWTGGIQRSENCYAKRAVELSGLLQVSCDATVVTLRIVAFPHIPNSSENTGIAKVLGEASEATLSPSQL